MILDHIGRAVRDFGRSGTFFRRALAPLGIHTVLEGEGWAMLGKDGKPQLWIGVHGIPPRTTFAAVAPETREEGAATEPQPLRQLGCRRLLERNGCNTGS